GQLLVELRHFLPDGGQFFSLLAEGSAGVHIVRGVAGRDGGLLFDFVAAGIRFGRRLAGGRRIMGRGRLCKKSGLRAGSGVVRRGSAGRERCSDSKEGGLETREIRAVEASPPPER